MGAKKFCGNCQNYNKISKQYGECLRVTFTLKNVNNGNINNVYVRVGKYNYCLNHNVSDNQFSVEQC